MSETRFSGSDLSKVIRSLPLLQITLLGINMIDRFSNQEQMKAYDERMIGKELEISWKRIGI